MTVDRAPIPAKARRRSVVPWRISIHRELDVDEMQAIVAAFLSGTSHHYVIAGDVYPGLTQITGDYWGTLGKGKDMAKVAEQWDQVEALMPELMLDAVLEYRVPAALLDPAPQSVVDLTSAP